MNFSFPSKRVTPEVIYARRFPLNLRCTDLETLKKIAASNPRQRARICTHPDASDSLHEMFIVHGRDAYVRPHRHLHRPEGIFVIEGKVDIILFSDAGCIKDVIRLDQAAFYLRLAEPVYHMLIIRSRELVFHEATTGPFEPADSEFAAWSPEDADTIGIALFLERVEAEITRFGDGGKGA